MSRRIRRVTSRCQSMNTCTRSYRAQTRKDQNLSAFQ